MYKYAEGWIIYFDHTFSNEKGETVDCYVVKQVKGIIPKYLSVYRCKEEAISIAEAIPCHPLVEVV